MKLHVKRRVIAINFMWSILLKSQTTKILIWKSAFICSSYFFGSSRFLIWCCCHCFKKSSLRTYTECWLYYTHQSLHDWVQISVERLEEKLCYDIYLQSLKTYTGTWVNHRGRLGDGIVFHVKHIHKFQCGNKLLVFFCFSCHFFFSSNVSAYVIQDRFLMIR